MSRILENISLKSLNTFGVESHARLYTEVKSEQDLLDVFNEQGLFNNAILVLGGGSNMLFTKDFEGLVIHMGLKGIRSEQEGDVVLVTAGGGEVWNDLVNYCVENNFAGMENLSLIPGSVGASPIQNIGAYGVELMDIFQSCRAFELETGVFREFQKQECKFSYRDSIFKKELKGKYVITEVTYRLSKTFVPKLTYGAIVQELKVRGILNPSIKNVSDIVSIIRVSKLPDPATIGNAGSFFKNPVISLGKFRHIQSAFPDIVHYVIDNEYVKLAAGWLIEQCGWKGKTIGHTGTWKNQALVLVNHGNATGDEILNLSADIIKSVHSRFGVMLEREVNII